MSSFPAGNYWSPARPPPTSTGHSLKILFDHSGDVLIWRPVNVLIWRSRDVPGRLIFSSSPRWPSKHSHLHVPRFLLRFLLELARLTKSIWKHFNTKCVLRIQSNFTENLQNSYFIISNLIEAHSTFNKCCKKIP